MFDCHYDLLTYVYINKNNLKKVKRFCKKVFKPANITGGIFNLFYMSLDQMKEELNIEKNEINVVENLELVNKLVKQYNIIPQKTKYIYGIEGLDYIKDFEDIDKLYNLGVRSVNIVWNNDNKFGGGAKGNKNQGLTKQGEELVKKLIDKKIAIDLSHANEKTFNDIINICNKEKGKNPIVLASHSNSKTICNVNRNLTDEQIIKIKELDGIIGIVGVKPFCIKEDNFSKNDNKYFNAYIEHINYFKNLLGDVENIAVSTDNMGYYKTNKKYYKYFNVFKQKSAKKKLEKLLKNNNYSQQEIEKILYLNFNNKILKKL